MPVGTSLLKRSISEPDVEALKISLDHEASVSCPRGMSHFLMTVPVDVTGCMNSCTGALAGDDSLRRQYVSLVSPLMQMLMGHIFPINPYIMLGRF